MNFDPGKTYEFLLADGTLKRLRFEGHGQYMRAIWRDVASGEEILDLPPFKSYRQID